MKRIINLLLAIMFLSSLTIFAKYYKGAEYRTIETFLYGRFEVSYIPAHREGVVSSFFTYHEIENSTGWNEIDLEFIGRYENHIQYNTITPGQKFHIRSQYLDFDPYSDFHVYAFEWTPEYVAWFVDGAEVFRQTGAHISTLQYPQKIMMNIWNPVFTNWVGYFDEVFLPTASVYDYVSYSSYNPGAGDSGTDNNFSFEWKDDFESFNSERWEKATHTFGGNQADFDPENIVFKDGTMSLFLTTETDKAGIDNIAPKILWAMANYDSTILIKFSEEVTKESIESTSNYILPGSIINSAVASGNNLYAKLYLQNYNPYALSNLIYSGFTDFSENMNVTTTKVVTIDRCDSIQFPIMINVGGQAYEDYMADQEWNSAAGYGYLMGDAHTYKSIGDISGTELDEIFKSDRRGLVNYKFKLPNDVYRVSFLFSDNTNHNAGEGIFNLIAEGDYIVNDLDVFSEVGNASFHKIEADIEVNDGILDIHFEEVVDSAFINGIIVNRKLTEVSKESNKIGNVFFQLYQNYPNPFNPETTISYKINGNSHVVLDIFDIMGRKSASLVNEKQIAGTYNYSFNGSEKSSGIYICRLMIDGNFSQSKKMIYLK